MLKKAFKGISSRLRDGSDDEDHGILQAQGQSSIAEPRTEPPIANDLDIFRYRYHHGANLGGIFVLEKWLFSEMFDEGCSGDSELDAVQTSLKRHGLSETRNKWEAHWASPLKQELIAQLLERHCTTVRIPIGYFTLGPRFCQGTPFEGEIAEVYARSWSIFTALCRELHRAGIGILVDFHACPGGANTDAHSGTSSGNVELWTSKSNKTLAGECLMYILKQIQAGELPGCIGLQLCNEAAKGHDDAVYAWYASMLDSASKIDNTIPIYISDAWDLPRASVWVRSHNSVTNHGNPVVIDTHKYFCFGDADKASVPEQIISRIPNEECCPGGPSGDIFKAGALDVIIGEWSCVIDGQTWDKASQYGHVDRDALVRGFGQAQSQRWHAAAGGHMFWTATMAWPPGGEWGFLEMSDKGAVQAPPYHTLDFETVRQRFEAAESQRTNRYQRCVGSHVGYWHDKVQGEEAERWRYRDGFALGWKDAGVFWMARVNGLVGPRTRGADRIGLLDLWMRKRAREVGQVTYESRKETMAWRWEHGFREGVGCFEKEVGNR
ncbi:Glucan 1,3-beta-glucosidase 3 [Agyrium rufum]|nr:Glucan 1,3-beta-glucosidase 3 [Agyrium rufum]